MTRAAVLSILLAVATSSGSPSLAAQGWSLDLYGGRTAYDLATSTLGENGAILGVRYQEPESHWLYVTSGIPFGSNESPWGAAGLGTRWVAGAGPLDLGADLGVQGYLYRDPTLAQIGGGSVLEARPLLGIGGRALRVEVRSGWVQYQSSTASSSFTRGVHDSDLNLHLAVGPWARLTGTVRHVRTEEDEYSFGGGRLTVGSRRLGAWGSIGGWTSNLLPTAEWGVGAYLGADDGARTRLVLSVRQETTDPIYWNSPRVRWSVGISHSFGSDRRSVRSSPPSTHPRPSLPPEISEGRATIRLPATGDGNSPSIAGDFTNWEPAPMTEEDGQWTASFQLEPGVYRYAFHSPSGEWYVPEGTAGRRPDGFGGYVAVLVVPEEER